MPADPDTTHALTRIEQSLSGLGGAVSELRQEVVRIGTKLDEQATMNLGKFDRVERDHDALKRDVRGDLESAKFSIHARVSRTEERISKAERAAQKAREVAQAATTRPIKIAAGAGTGVGAAVVGGLVALWEWLKHGGNG